MAATMLVGIVTTLVISEPVSRGQSSYFHGATDYARFLLLFLFFVTAFVGTFTLLSGSVAWLNSWLSGDAGQHRALAGFLSEAARLLPNEYEPFYVPANYAVRATGHPRIRVYGSLSVATIYRVEAGIRGSFPTAP